LWPFAQYTTIFETVGSSYLVPIDKAVTNQKPPKKTLKMNKKSLNLLGVVRRAKKLSGCNRR
jgi:hypothetical protein